MHKTTIYRNWKDSDSLVTQALAAHFAADVPPVPPDTGSVTTDLRELAHSLVTTLMTPTGRALLNAVLSDAAHLPQVAEIKRALFDDRFRRAEPVVARAIDRGELPKDTDPVELLKALAAPVYFRLVCTGEPIDETTADRAAEGGALAAARGGRGGAELIGETARSLIGASAVIKAALPFRRREALRRTHRPKPFQPDALHPVS